MEDKGGNSYKPNEDLSKWQSFKRGIYDSDKGEFLGRTGLSWFKITLFYIIFYACLAAFWTCMLVVFYQTLQNDQPKWKLDSSRIGTSPGLGFRPTPPDNNVDSTLIWYDASKSETVDYWTKSLDHYLEPYNRTSVGGKVKTCDKNQTATADTVCYFALLKSDHSCSAARQYGFTERKPCILIKLNRIYGWKPESYDDGDVPKALLDIIGTYDRNKVYITCHGENSADKDNIGQITYYPENGGIDFNYFPFTNQDDYMSPFVFAQFGNVNHKVLVNVECRAWAKNINFDRGDRLGSVHFELLVD